MFKILKKDKSTNARTGILITPHGKILTPAYTIVATHAEIKCLKPQDIAKTNTQVVISNTYHLWNFVPKQLPIYNFKFTNKNKKTFLLNKLGSNMPTMTDSGGFQVFSLGFGKENKVGKILKNGANLRMYANQQIKRQQIKITDKGVFFNIDGQRRFLNPEISMKLQEKLGADIIFAFDECTSPLDDFKYNKKALERTHRWAKKCLSLMANRQSQDKQQMLFGIVQGGRFKSLRVKSAKFIGSLPFDGFGIGGSFGQNEMLKTLKIVIPHLPEEKPRHLLGIGKIRDVFNAVENGVDSFDCVIPTREARHGRIYTRHGHYNISKNRNKNISLEKGCKCPACKLNISRSKLNALFKADLPRAQRFATLHNVWFFNNLMKNIRASIDRGSFKTFKKKFLSGI
ncbi:MAG: hypothetical protein A2746_00600 [Candidatus Yanofskybacteria bacterium RIFCSPHIGHO2_01_FULL_44_22]|uniref:tRNA-guanine(15) transglycosylase-like domain-containing protein n=1 Tax=Candidatus Yanofskybacteria bacterium RIFCSPHIGHO2_01_FULL_44_22 TaxID=1802669 RepID=A0A1F8EWY2_9BACT|nr:MAG: hypothetical protein A2746_00600 [Candidatus Yanofskybacteria bacterium RIFCSPHIGHO2_01_FULL_44_22]OGN10304.1 MAG: hypothetical protein A3C64_01560 [Candidatus Yanofskybacteria bacterium RIFCSPHIGHO2_02_FULL_41_12]